MGFAEQFEALQKKVADAKASIVAAGAESRAQLHQRIDKAQVDLDLAKKNAQQKADEVSSGAESSWAKLRADTSRKVDDVRGRIDKRNAERDAKKAASDADWAEADAADAIEYASWAVDNARLAALDALDARAHADERAQAVGDKSS